MMMSVGWVERSETHRVPGEALVGYGAPISGLPEIGII
jgi:hypothetical protein